MGKLNAQVKCEVQKFPKISQSCSFCGIETDLLESSIDRKSVDKYFNPELFKFLYCTTTKLCYVCLNFMKSLTLLHTTKESVNEELEQLKERFDIRLQKWSVGGWNSGPREFKNHF